MAGTTCFWSILTLQQLEFIYVSPTKGSQPVFSDRHELTIRDILLHRSLLDFIHPDEWAIAKQDLSTFLRRKTLAGAVTRCRLRSFASIAKNINPCQFEDENIDHTETWNVVDVVMYIVTDCVVLAFFHTQDNCQEHSVCGEPYFDSKDVDLLLSALQKHQPPTPFSTPTINNDCCNSDRVLQMYDQSTKRRLFSWPPSTLYYNPDAIQLSPESLPSQQELAQKSWKSGVAACMQHTHTQSVCTHPSSSVVSPSSSPPSPSTSPCCRLERIVISYGSILFYSFQINSTSQSSILPHQQIGTTKGIAEQPAKHIQLYHHHTSTDTQQKQSFATNSQYIPPMDSHFHQAHYHQRPYHHPFPLHHPHSSPISAHHQPVKRCVRCGTNNSPEWRRGPTGHKTLCNACGLRYSRLMSKQQAGSKVGFRRNS